MNEIRKEKLRIANLVMEIADRGFDDVSLDFGRTGSVAITITFWQMPVGIRETWYLYSGDGLPKYRKIRHDLEQMLKAGKAQAMGVAA